MSFQQAMQQYHELCRQYHAGQLDYARFCQVVDELRVQDGSGSWWQLSYDGQWLCWNGAEWLPGQPPTAAMGPQWNPDSVRQAVNYAQTTYGAAQTLASGNPAAIVGRAAGVLSPLAGKSQKWWNLVSILGGGVGGGLWYWYSTLDKTANIKSDPVTALIMLAVPIVLVVFRKPLDSLLATLNPIRQKFPPLLIVGIGVAVPYLTATYLYDSAGMREYSYIRWTAFLGPLLSYLIIRTPHMPGNPGAAGGLPGGVIQQNYSANRLGRR